MWHEAGHAVHILNMGDAPNAGNRCAISELDGLRRAEIRHNWPWQANAHSQMKDRCRVALTSLSFIAAMLLRAQFAAVYERHGQASPTLLWHCCPLDYLQATLLFSHRASISYTQLPSAEASIR